MYKTGMCSLSPGTKKYQDYVYSVGKALASSLIFKLPFIAQGNKYLFFSLFSISELKDVYIQGKDTQAYCQCSSSLWFWPKWSDHPFPRVPGCLTPPVPSSLPLPPHTTCPCHSLSVLMVHFLLSVVRMTVWGGGDWDGLIMTRFHMEQVRLCRYMGRD